ncbi:MAG: hypothetical protein KGD58_00470 [Candidatus Lokiarchaeota archaeon]|nr:hypothetical protein [Candidatus Lokiarchaeota archaeon]
MKDLNDIPEFSNYFRVISPSDVEVNKGDIFYRDKYNDIINYIKAMSTFNSDNPLNEYISPKGTILINVNPGTDISEFLKLISMNYSLDLIEFNDTEIKKTPDKFLKSFLQILKSIRDAVAVEAEEKSEEDTNNNLDDSDTPLEKKLLIINQHSIFRTILSENNLLEVFVTSEKEVYSNFLHSNIILIWINYDLRDVIEISSKVYEVFDIFIKISLLNKIERETILRDFLEKNSKIVFDVDALVNYTDNWEVKDIKQLLKVGIFKHFLNSELNETSNEITHILLDLIETGEFLPSINSKNSNDTQNGEEGEESKHIQYITKIEEENSRKANNIDDYINSIRDSRPSEFMINQLYENAAFSNYNELLLIIDKIDKKEPLEENDRKILAEYPFILTETPKRAQIKLEKAKKRVDRIRQAFGK